jgi:hypothetical protein
VFRPPYGKAKAPDESLGLFLGDKGITKLALCVLEEGRKASFAIPKKPL